MSPRPPSLDARRQPTQQRGRETVDRLLDATAALLEEAGFEALTTNKIAARAEVNVASLYKYFPNKYALIRALAERNMERQRELIALALEKAGEGDWKKVTDLALDGFLEHLVNEPGYAAVGEAIRVSPALQELETAGFPAMIEMLEETIRERCLPKARRRVPWVARVVVSTADAVLMAARLEEPPERKKMVDELKRMLVAYLLPIFDEEAP